MLTIRLRENDYPLPIHPRNGQKRVIANQSQRRGKMSAVDQFRQPDGTLAQLPILDGTEDSRMLMVVDGKLPRSAAGALA